MPPNVGLHRMRLRGLEIVRYLKSMRRIEPLYREILSASTLDGLRQVIRTHHTRGTFHGSKYQHYRWYLRENLGRAIDLGLLGQNQKRVLDLGCGPGYFLAACTAMGHDSLGVDLPGSSFFGGLREALMVEVVDHRITPSDLDGMASDIEFDLVTAFSITFNRTDDGECWTTSDWLRLLDSLDRRLTKVGRGLFRFNCANPSQEGGPKVLIAAAADHGVFEVVRRDSRTLELFRRLGQPMIAP